MEDARTGRHGYYFNVIAADTPRLGIHSHTTHELYFLENSETTYFIDKQVIPVKAGEMFFVPKGVMHYTKYDKALPAKRHIVYIDDSTLRDEIKPYLERLATNNHITLPPERIGSLMKIFEKLNYEETHDFQDKKLASVLYIEQLLVMIERYGKEKLATNIDGIQRTVQDVASYINANITEDLRLDTLAKKFNISTSHLSKQFKKVTGVGISEYINISRITESEKIMDETENLSITEVALACGFNDSNYFARVFKRIKGTTPKAYYMNR